MWVLPWITPHLWKFPYIGKSAISISFLGTSPYRFWQAPLWVLRPFLVGFADTPLDFAIVPYGFCRGSHHTFGSFLKLARVQFPLFLFSRFPYRFWQVSYASWFVPLQMLTDSLMESAAFPFYWVCYPTTIFSEVSLNWQWCNFSMTLGRFTCRFWSPLFPHMDFVVFPYGLALCPSPHLPPGSIQYSHGAPWPVVLVKV